MSMFVRMTTSDGIDVWVRSTEVVQVYSDGGKGSFIEVRNDSQVYESTWRPKKVARKIIEWEAGA